MKVVAKKSANAMDTDQDQHDDNEIKHSPRQSSTSNVLHQPLLKSSDFQTDILKRAVPWEDLATFLTTIPKKYGPSKQGVIPSSTNTAKRGWSPTGVPLPYQKSRKALGASVALRGLHAEIVDGFSWSNVSKSWKCKATFGEGEIVERTGSSGKQEEEERKSGRRWADESMEVDEDETAESEESGDDSEEVKALKARQQYLRTLLQPVQQDCDTSTPLVNGESSSLSSMVWHPTPLAKQHRAQLHTFSRISLHMASPSESPLAKQHRAQWHTFSRISVHMAFPSEYRLQEAGGARAYIDSGKSKLGTRSHLLEVKTLSHSTKSWHEMLMKSGD
ncbi:hypothetical protein M378DRAFT_17409 [Amanita muscaria Koide BX008]|uniref:Uncharacterized protein n=1 Tax=Amanita muscaria (strain Koide BX008) TaxID=946122 RepID=A0A0C2S099_AMAMK|nr:hypothetical protein M378DRAFT_17409 [Amanita muscaria Koide BX008]